MVLFKWNIPRNGVFNPKIAKNVLDKESKSFLLNATSTYKVGIKEKAPVGATSQLKNTIGSTVTKRRGLVYTGVDYAIVVEEGRRPGATPPPIRAMLKWIRASSSGKDWSTKVKINRKSKLYSFAKSLKEKGYPGSITQIAKAIILSRSIGKKGIDGKKFFEKGIESVQNIVNNFLNDYTKNIGIGLVK